MERNKLDPLPEIEAAEFLKEVEEHNRKHQELARRMLESIALAKSLDAQVARLEARVTTLERAGNARGVLN